MKTLKLFVTSIVRAQHDAILVYLTDLSKEEILYQPGQFITLIFQFGERELRRSYSIFTTPGVDKELGVLVKRLVNGEVSRQLVDHLAPGDILDALPPAGRFVLPAERRPDEQVVFIAAGSGISPIISLIKQALYVNALPSVSLIYQSRNEATTLFQQELTRIKNDFPTEFYWINLWSNPADHSRQPARLNNTLLEQILQSGKHFPAAGHFFLCGPPAFMRMCQFVLHLMKVPDEQIHREIFYFEGVPAAPLVHDQTTRLVKLLMAEEPLLFHVQYPQTILEAALKSGIRLPYSCRGGRCSSCTLKCVSGKVKMSINEVLTERDLGKGLVLTCVGYPESDLVLSLA